MADETKQPTTNAPPQTPVTELPQGGGVLAPGGGAVAAPNAAATAAAPLPSGGITLGVDDDVEEKLKKAAPAFGNVLAAIGNAIAESQMALDKSVIDTINKLNDTTIDVVNQVEIELNDDGTPFGDEEHTKLVKNTVSVLQYYTPVFHSWKRVDIAMDLAVGGFHATQGVQFSAKQSNTSVGGGLSWSKGFSGWFSASHSSSQQSAQISSQSDAEWSSGQLLVDAELGSRPTAKFPPAAEIAVGPQILIRQGKITEAKTNNVVTSREVELNLMVRKASGAVNPAVGVVIEAPGLLGGGGVSTDSNGKIQVMLKRDLSGGTTGFRQFPLSINLGDIKKPYTLTL